jgi:hypothetical protein
MMAKFAKRGPPLPLPAIWRQAPQAREAARNATASSPKRKSSSVAGRFRLTRTNRATDSSVVTDDRLYEEKERPAAFAQALSKLAGIGSTAWNSLVGSGGVGHALNAIGKMLEDNPPAAGASIQIICETQGVDFIFPWTLLYATPYSTIIGSVAFSRCFGFECRH